MKLLFFTQPNCAPCRALKPVAESVADELGLDLVYKDATVSADLEVFTMLNVRSTPTLYLLKDAYYQIIRSKTKAELIAELQSVIANND